MSENKTQPTDASVVDFIEKIDNPNKKSDAYVLLEMFKEVSKEVAVIWGKSIIGFGNFKYKYASGREGDWLIMGFSPRKQKHSLYLSFTMEEYTDLLPKLGKHKLGKGCLYINKLADVDLDVLKEILIVAWNRKVL